MPIGISSVYYAKKIPDGNDLLDALLALGFDGLELEYRVRAETLEQMAPRLGHEIPVLSVHAFFPNPEQAGGTGSGANAFLFSSLDREKREEAVRQGVVTMEAAFRLGARAVVLHLGRVAVADEDLVPYRRLVVAEDPDLTAIRKTLGPILSGREGACGPHFDAALSCLDRLNREALRRGIILGVENRSNPHEIPNFEELGRVLREFRGGAVRYWHDVGHAAYQERLGMLPHDAWLEAYGSDLAGTHLHDIRGGRDHLAPGTGEMDFAAILRRLPPDAIKILEIRSSVPRDELLAAGDYLRGLGY